MSEQVPFGEDDFGAGLGFAENPEPRCPCILLLDTSGSMSGNPIIQLNEGLQSFKEELTADSLAAKRVEVALLTFGGQVQTLCDFASVQHFNPPTLAAGGDTPMGAAILRACELLRQRKDQYRTHGVAFYRPWLFLITDGAPTDQWRSAADEVRTGEAKKAFVFFAVGVEGANFDILKQIAIRDPLHVQGLKFRKLFEWLSNSLTAVSRSRPGDEVPLSNPTAPGGWASV
jgi:uncharacterized protein YegL